MAELWTNNAASTLSGGIDSSVTSLVVAVATAFPASGNFRIIIDSEIIIVGVRAGTTFSTLTRGAEGTTAAAHSNGVAVTHILTKGGLDAYLLDATHLGTGTPNSTKFLRGDDVWSLVPNIIGYRVFTSSGTYTPTTNTTSILVQCVGGGGAGGGTPSSGAGVSVGGGGGGGGYSAKLITSGFSGDSYVVGAGGTTAAGGTGGSGADTTWDATTVVAKGGTGGTVGVTATDKPGSAGGLASGGVGDIRMDGQYGEHGQVGGGLDQNSGQGGSSVMGIGGRRATLVSTSVVAGGAGGAYGGGGSGSGVQNTASVGTGGAGAAGVIIVTEFT